MMGWAIRLPKMSPEKCKQSKSPSEAGRCFNGAISQSPRLDAARRWRHGPILPNREQVVVPVGEPRCRALAEFVFLMILVHAERAYHDGDYDAAITQLDEVYRDYSKDPMVVFLRGLILAAKGEREKAKSLAAALRGDQQAVDALMRACRNEIPRMSASASSPISSGPSFGSGGYSRFGRW